MRILVVRLSALGDIVHILPALTDLRRAHPHAHITVAVDERFVDVVGLHGGMDRILSIALKRWKKSLSQASTWQELRQTVRGLRQDRYDLVVDMHGLNKSAIVTGLARGRLKVGMSREFCGEWLGPWVYDKACHFGERRSRVTWMRDLMAQATGQPLEGPPDFGLKLTWQGQASRRIALVHSTADVHRLWPEADWVALGRRLVERGHDLVLPWGTPDEKARAQRLAEAIGGGRCEVAPPLSIAGWAEALSQCRLVIGLDTGLVHIAAAVGVPCLGIFNLTDPALLTVQAPAPMETTGGHGQQSSLPEVLAATERLLTDA